MIGGQAFEVTVTYPNGQVKRFRSVPGGGPMTAGQLSEHYQMHNAFPGASNIEIQEAEVSGGSKSLLAAVRAGRPPAIRGLSTPKATIVSRPGGARPGPAAVALPGTIDHAMAGADETSTMDPAARELLQSRSAGPAPAPAPAAAPAAGKHQMASGAIPAGPGAPPAGAAGAAGAAEGK